MVISARYKHFLYFPLRLIDHPSPEVREYLSSSCRIIKIQSKKYSSTPHPFLGPTQLLFLVTRAPSFPLNTLVTRGQRTLALRGLAGEQ